MDVKTVKNQPVDWLNTVARKGKANTEQGVFEAIFSSMQQTPASSRSSSAARTDKREATAAVDVDKRKERRTVPNDDSIRGDELEAAEQSNSVGETQTEILTEDVSAATAQTPVPEDAAGQVTGEAEPQEQPTAGLAAESSTAGKPVTVMVNMPMTADSSCAVATNTPGQGEPTLNTTAVTPAPENVTLQTPASAATDGLNTEILPLSTESAVQGAMKDAAASEPTADSGTAPKSDLAAAPSVHQQNMSPDTELPAKVTAPPTLTTEVAAQPAASKADNTRASTSAPANVTVTMINDGKNNYQDNAPRQDSQAGQHQETSVNFLQEEINAEGEKFSGATPRQTAAETVSQMQEHRQNPANAAEDAASSDIAADAGAAKTMKTPTPMMPSVTAATEDAASFSAVKNASPTPNTSYAATVPASEMKLSEPQVQRNIDDIVKSAQTAMARHSSRIQLRLDPPELGLLRVEIRSGRDGLQLQLQATTVKAHELLKQNSSELKTALEQQGLPTGRIEIQLRMDLQENASHSSSEQQSGGRQYSSPQQQGQGSFQQESQQPSEGQDSGRSFTREPAFSGAAADSDDGWREMDFARLDVTV